MRRPLIVFSLTGDWQALRTLQETVRLMGLAYYYSSRKKGILVKVRNPRTAAKVEIEAKSLNLNIEKRYDA
jgi:hypothetical protein